MRRVVAGDLKYACPQGRERFKHVLPNGFLPTRLGVLAAIRKIESMAAEPGYRGPKTRRGQMRNIKEVFFYALEAVGKRVEFEHRVHEAEGGKPNQQWRTSVWGTNRRNLDGRITIFADVLGEVYA